MKPIFKSHRCMCNVFPSTTHSISSSTTTTTTLASQKAASLVHYGTGSILLSSSPAAAPPPPFYLFALDSFFRRKTRGSQGSGSLTNSVPSGRMIRSGHRWHCTRQHAFFLGNRLHYHHEHSASFHNRSRAPTTQLPTHRRSFATKIINPQSARNANAFTFKTLIQQELNESFTSPQEFIHLFEALTHVAHFNETVVAPMKEMQITEKYITQSTRYTSLWKKLFAAMANVTSKEIHQNFLQWFVYCHGNYMHVLDDDLIVQWLHYLSKSGDVHLLVATVERLVKASPISPQYLVIGNRPEQGDNESDTTGNTPPTEPQSSSQSTELKATENAQQENAAAKDSESPFPIPPPLTDKVIRERFLTPHFFSHVFHDLIMTPLPQKQALANKYIEKYYRQYFMNPNKVPYIAPAHNKLIFNILKAHQGTMDAADFLTFCKHLLPFIDCKKYTNDQLDRFAGMMRYYLVEKADEHATFIIHLYERYFSANPLVLQNSRFLYGIVSAYAHVGSFEKAAEIYGVSFTRSVLGGLPEPGDPTNILEQIEHYGTMNPNFKIPADATALIAKTIKLNDRSRNPDFELVPMRMLFDKMIQVYSHLGKWKMMRFVFEQYLDSKDRRYLERKVVNRMIIGYILNKRMKEAVALYAQFCRGENVTLNSLPPSSYDVVRIVEGFVQEQDYVRAFKFFDTCVQSSPQLLHSLELKHCKFFAVVLDHVCAREPSVAAAARRYLLYFRKRANEV
uniref:Uncharacterized protein n=1 Tax=Percolomonas cosmopolitus TaxID=63605 RepID=A0A7S1PIP7_9EUKA|mmetsp:Transcript_853/g.2928  ORF Transcript_853/g.2928 Transcript_853/m.2928 type:complete len:736 (+) Transcript_853:431-2638(+)